MKFLIGIGVYGLALTVVSAQHMTPDAAGVIVGVVVGIVASVPVHLLLLALLRRERAGSGR